MRTNGKTFYDNRTAAATSLACTGRLDGDDLSTGTFSLVLDHLPEHAQSRVMRGKGKIAVGYKGKAQILNRNIAVIVDDLAGSLMPEPAPGIGDFLMQNGDLTSRLTPIRTAFLATGQATLSNSQFGKATPQPARIVDDSPVRERQQVVQTNVNPHIRSFGSNRRNVRQFQHQANIPFAERPFDHNMLDGCALRQFPMKDDFYLSYVLDVKPVGFEFAPVTVAILYRAKSFGVLEARLAGTSFVKRLVCLIDTPKHLLNRGRIEHPHFIGQGMTFVAHPVPLLDISHRPARPLPRLTALVKRVVVDGLHLTEQAIQKIALFLGRSQSELVSADHLLAFLLVNVSFNRFRRDISRSSDIVRARPQGRQSAIQVRKLTAQFVSRIVLEPMNDLAWGQRRRKRAKQMNVVRLDNKLDYFSVKFGGLCSNQRFKSGRNLAHQNGTAKLWNPDKMIVDTVCTVSRSFRLHKRIIAHMFYQCNKRRNFVPLSFPSPLKEGVP
jgi:hypothetical protein